MKICFFAHAANLTGANRSMLNLICENKKRGVDALVILPSGGVIESELNAHAIAYKVIKSYSLMKPVNDSRTKYLMKSKIKEYFNFKAIHTVGKLLIEEKVDIIHINSLITFYGAIVANKLKIPYIWHLRDFLSEDHGYEFLNKKQIQKLMRNADQLVAVSNDVKQYFSAHYEIAINQIKTIYNGLPIKEYILEKERDLQSQHIKMSILGRVVEGKGQFDAIKAVELLVNDGITQIELSVVGSGIDKKEYEHFLHDYVKKHKLEEYVKFFSFTTATHVFRENCQLAIVCSKKEAFGRVTIEGMLAKQLVIAANTGGSLEIISDKNTGLLYEQGNHKDLAEKIKWAIGNPTKTNLIINKGQKSAIENYSITSTSSRILKVYEELVDK